MKTRIRLATSTRPRIVPALLVLTGLVAGIVPVRAQMPAATVATAPVQYQYVQTPAATTTGYTYPTYTYAPATTGTTYTYGSYYAAPAGTTYAMATTAASGGDAYGFMNWLNGVRAQYGLAPVSYDPSLESWAAVNSSQQAARGLGHFTMGPARRQNSAMGSIGSIGSMWLNSPAHRAALLDPSVRWVGLAGAGAYWTLNLR